MIWAARHGFDAERIIAVAHGRRTEETIREIASHLDCEAEAADLERIEVEDAENVLKVNGANDLIASLSPEGWLGGGDLRHSSVGHGSHAAHRPSDPSLPGGG